MDAITPEWLWLNVARTGILLLTVLLGWVTYRSHLLLKEFQPEFNLLLSLPEVIVRLLLVGVLFIGFPDGAEIINLAAASLMAVAMVPYGVRLIMKRAGRPGPQSAQDDPMMVG